MRQHKRRHYFIDKDFQGKFIFPYILSSFLSIFIAAGGFIYLAYRKIEDLQWRMFIDVDTVGEIVTPYLLYSSALSLFLALTSVFFITCFIIHKSSGPISRMKADIERVAKGNLMIDIGLRSNDVFKTTAKELDDMSKTLRRKFIDIGENYRRAEKSIDIIAYAEQKPETMFRTCEQLMHSIESLKRSIENLRK